MPPLLSSRFIQSAIFLALLLVLPILHTAAASRLFEASEPVLSAIELLQDEAAEADEADAPPLLARILNIDPDDPPDAVVFIGRFHPLLVHMPIALLLLAFLLEFMTRSKRFADLRPSVSFVLFLGAVSAVFAVGAGLLLAISGGYGGDELWWHKWLGISVAVTAVAAYVYKRKSLKTEVIQTRRVYGGLITVSALLLMAASHFGGSLTHGSDYLTSYMPEPFRTWAGVEPRDEVKPILLANVDEAHVFNDIIAPIFDARCVSCHNTKKKKGELLLTSRAAIEEGGENGAIFIAGNAEDSEVYRRLILSSDDDDRMPPTGRKPLSDDHINLIKWWVDSGAPFDNTVAELTPPEDVRSILDRMSAEAEEAAYAIVVPPADPAALESLREMGVLIMPLSQETNLLQAQFLNAKEGLTDKDLERLLPISEQIAWLNLGRSPIGDESMPTIGQLKNLTRLHLEKTGVTDDGLSHLQNLERLEYLNLYGTSVSDAGLTHLSSLERLRSLYLWQSNATPEGVAQLKSTLPNLDVNMGWEFTAAEADSTQDEGQPLE